MAGLINDEDIAEVRARARIDDIVGAHVMLKRAGSGTLKGLCPFHDEKTPSFQVTPSRGFFHCFGCGEGGDVITFVQKIDNLSFVEAVEMLADKVGVQLRYTDGGGHRTEPGLRTRILEANQAAAEFFERQLMTPAALAGRQFLDQRGFSREAAEHFGVGFAPRGGRDLRHHLERQGFPSSVLIKAGLVRENGGWDFFQGRLLWPIRDSGGHVVGFGARRIFDDDRMPAKYINTTDTPVYRKSSVLYGLDLARRNIGKKAQAVVVEGYTDVMAAHLAGVDTAVASCGTAFGDDHAKLLQRLMGNHDAFNGEVIFTFDGDAAGQAAAMKVFKGDRNFTSQTYVAVEPNGLDPCDLRLQHGDEAVRDLIGQRIPLYRFVMERTIAEFDLDRADGRLAALRAAAPLVTSVRDKGLVGQYARELSGLIGIDMDEVRREIARAQRRGDRPEPEPRRRSQPVEGDGPEPEQPSRRGVPIPPPGVRELAVERDTLKLLIQHPELLDASWYGIEADDFTADAYKMVYRAAREAATVGVREWASGMRDLTEDPGVAGLIVELAVEPILHEPDARYFATHAAKLRLLTVLRQIADLKSWLQRTDPIEGGDEYRRRFGELLELEQRRTRLQTASVGFND